VLKNRSVCFPFHLIFNPNFPEESFSVSVFFDEGSFESEMGWVDGSPAFDRRDQHWQSDNQAQSGQA
jgi:hypothetical protein